MAKYKIIPSSRTIAQLPISIGHKAEKGVEAIEFDLTAWVETYGSGTLTVIMRRWGDAIPYPIALEIDENNKATWTLSDIDTAKAGMAYAQLNYIVGDEVVKKSDIYTFRVMDSLTGEGEPPEAYESWLEQLTHLAAEAMAEVLDIEGIVTDKTLSVDGGIADAKKVGDKFDAVNESLGAINDEFKGELEKTFAPNTQVLTCKIGEFMRVSDGKNVIQSGAKTFARTTLFYSYRAPAAVRLENNNYRFCVFFYDETGSISSGRGYIGNSGYVVNEFVHIDSTARLFGVVFTRNDGVELTSQDAETILNDLRCYGHTDNTLTLSDIPADAKATGERIAGAIAEAFDTFIEEIPHPFLHMRPRTIGAYNAVRRARQLSDLRWTPAEDNKIRREYHIPANTYEETREHGFRDDSNFFEASKEYIGAPYSSRNGKRIGTNIGLETFVTSSAMEKSVMLTESESVRDWGSTYYGTTCSNLVSYALSLPPIATENMVWYENGVKKMMPGLSFIHDIMVNGEPQDMSDAEIADILWTPGHCAMITDMIKSNGVVTDIEVTESSMTYLGTARRWMWKADDFYRWFSAFGVYRYSDYGLSKIEYFPNVCAPMPDEGKRFVYVNKQIMPYLGNKCIIYVDNAASVRLIVRNVEDNLGTPVYTHILVRKNGEQYGAPIAIDLTKGTEPHYVDISLDVDEAIYTAMLCNYENGVISKYTAECEWVVTPVHVPQITFSNDNVLGITVNFKNSFFKPSYFIASITTNINNRNAIHISPDMLTEVTESDGSITYTITKEYESYRDLKKIRVGYVSPYHGTIIETYSV